jgi:hypothetical protein
VRADPLSTRSIILSNRPNDRAWKWGLGRLARDGVVPPKQPDPSENSSRHRRSPHCDEPHNPAPSNRSSHGPVIKVMAMSLVGSYRRIREAIVDLRQ